MISQPDNPKRQHDEQYRNQPTEPTQQSEKREISRARHDDFRHDKRRIIAPHGTAHQRRGERGENTGRKQGKSVVPNNHFKREKYARERRVERSRDGG